MTHCKSFFYKSDHIKVLETYLKESVEVGDGWSWVWFEPLSDIQNGLNIMNLQLGEN